MGYATRAINSALYGNPSFALDLPANSPWCNVPDFRAQAGAVFLLVEAKGALHVQYVYLTKPAIEGYLLWQCLAPVWLVFRAELCAPLDALLSVRWQDSGPAPQSGHASQRLKRTHPVLRPFPAGMAPYQLDDPGGWL